MPELEGATGDDGATSVGLIVGQDGFSASFLDD